MKKIIFGVLFLGLFSGLSADQIPPLIITGTIIAASTTSATITLSAAGNGQRNCLTHFSEVGTVTGGAFAIIDGSLATGTTIYLSSAATSVPISEDRTFDTALCGSLNTALTLNSTAITPQINYQGYTRSTR